MITGGWNKPRTMPRWMQTWLAPISTHSIFLKSSFFLQSCSSTASATSCHAELGHTPASSSIPFQDMKKTPIAHKVRARVTAPLISASIACPSAALMS